MKRTALNTVGRLAREFGLSRATLLYYEREELLVPSRRAPNGYRLYDERDRNRLRRILGYRACGVPIREIRGLLRREGQDRIERALRRQFERIEDEIAELRSRQRALVSMLEHADFSPPPESDRAAPDATHMTVERWTAIMREAGLTDEDMAAWHRAFEASEPEGHRDFLASLNLAPPEIERIRAWSRAEREPADDR